MTYRSHVNPRELFVGRRVELGQFDQAILSSNRFAAFLLGPGFGAHPRIFLLYGMGGMGKTWLARECLKHAHQAGWGTAEIE